MKLYAGNVVLAVVCVDHTGSFAYSSKLTDFWAGHVVSLANS